MTLRYQHLIQSVDTASGNSKKHKPFRILEIGVFDADHGRQMIEQAARNGRIFVEYYGFDMFEQMTFEVNEAEVGKKTLAKSEDEVMKYLKAKTKARIIKLFKGDTKKTLPAEVPGLPKMDIIFVDGGHSLGTVQSDFEYALKLAHNKTIILLDDYYPGDFTKGCAFLVDNDLKSRGNLKVEVLEPVDIYPKSGISVQFVKVSFSDNLAEPSSAVETTPAPHPVEVPPEPQNFRTEDSVHNTDVQPAELRSTCSGVGTCEYTGQPCDGGGRCQPRVDGFDLEKVPKPQVDIAPIPEERQEPNQELELGVVESQGVAHTDNGSDEQRRDIPEELAHTDSERPSKRARRSRRSGNKLSRPQTEATDSKPDEGLSAQ